MSYDKVIGFGQSSDTGHRVLSGQEVGWIQRTNTTPQIHDLKNLLPSASKEPEPKLLLNRPRQFGSIRNLIQAAPNSFMIPGQLYADSTPLVSLLLDTKRRDIPTCEIVRSGYSLRWRANMCTKDGVFSQRDFNEKSTAVTSEVIGGCIDRDEREHECRDDQTNKEGYEDFLAKYRTQGNPSFCDATPYERLHVYAGYVTARTIYGFAVKHPQHDLILVCEACEDHTQTLAQDMRVTASYKEFEFEPKQIVGTIPPFIQSPEMFKAFLYRFMHDIQKHIQANIADSQLNSKSKADMAREHLEHISPFNSANIDMVGLSPSFQKRAARNVTGQDLIAEKAALYFGGSLDDVIANERQTIHQIAAKLMRDKRVEKDFITPDDTLIGHGPNRSFLTAPGQTTPTLRLN
jgi:hypothetical protein